MIETQENQLVKVVEESGLEKQTALNLKEKFLPFFEQAGQWKEKAESLIVTDVSQIREMQMARQARLALKEIRVQADKTRKALKEDSLRYGKAVQGVYNVIEYLIAPIEKHLEEQEKFAEIQEAKRKAEIRAKREIELEPFMGFCPYVPDLGEVTESDYQKLLNGAKLQLKAQQEAEARAEAERIERERLDNLERERRIEIAPFVQFLTSNQDLRNMPENDYQNLFTSLKKAKSDHEAEQEKIRQENERLRKERELEAKKAAEERAKADAEKKAIEEKARKEREAIEAKLKAEKEAREKIEREARRKQEAEEKARKEAEAKAIAEAKAKVEAERKAEMASDKEKLTRWVDSFDLPTISQNMKPESIELSKEIEAKFASFQLWAKSKIAGLK